MYSVITKRDPFIARLLPAFEMDLAHVLPHLNHHTLVILEVLLVPDHHLTPNTNVPPNSHHNKATIHKT
jgi:hypothetical protein